MSKYDVVVVGGGAAGCPQPWSSPVPAAGSWWWMGLAPQRPGHPPARLSLARRHHRPQTARRGRTEVGATAATSSTALSPTSVPDGRIGFRVLLADGQRIAARRLLVTTGLRDELPDIPGSGRPVGPGCPALPVLPWPRGTRPRARRHRRYSRRRPVRPYRSPVDLRPGLFHPPGTLTNLERTELLPPLKNIK